MIEPRMQEHSPPTFIAPRHRSKISSSPSLSSSSNYQHFLDGRSVDRAKLSVAIQGRSVEKKQKEASFLLFPLFVLLSFSFVTSCQIQFHASQFVLPTFLSLFLFFSFSRFLARCFHLQAKRRKTRETKNFASLIIALIIIITIGCLDVSTMNTSDACSYNASTCYFIDDRGNCLSDRTVLDLILHYVVPKYYEWICIVLYVIVFLVGTIGNLLVIIVIQRNRSMR